MTQPKAPVDPGTEHKESEVHSGSNTFGFFHRHQKLIIYTAGIFTLLTFSVTGALLGVTDRIFDRAIERPTMEIPGVAGLVEVTEEDVNAAKGISQVRNSGAQLICFPAMSFGDLSSGEYVDQLAALHALARSAGIDASDDDVDRILETAIQTYPNIENEQQLAFLTRTNDVTLFRTWVRQALRVSTFLRLSTMGVGLTDEGMVEGLIKENEQITFQVAYADSKGYREEIKKGLDDEALKKYLEELDDTKAEKFRKPANRTSVKIAMLENASFTPEEYVGAELAQEDAEIGDDAIQDRYLRDREARYKLPPAPVKNPDDLPGDKKKTPENKDNENKGNENKAENKSGGKTPAEEAAEKKAAAEKAAAEKAAAEKAAAEKAAAEKAKKKGTGNGGPGDGLEDDESADDCSGPEDELPQNPQSPGAQAPKQKTLKLGEPPTGAQDDPQKIEGELDAPAQYKPLDEKLKADIKTQLMAEKVLAKWQAELDKLMAAHMEEIINGSAAAEIAVEDAKEAKAEAEAELEKNDDESLKEGLEAKVKEAEKKVETAEAAAKAAKEAVDARRKLFDFDKAVQGLAKGRKGLKIVAVAEMKDAEGLKEIEGVGKWLDSHLPGQMGLAGEVYNGRVQTTDKGAFIFQVTGIEERQFKKFEDIKEDLESQYLSEKAEADAKKKKESFEKALERLAREKQKDEVAKLEKEGEDEIAKKFGEWKSKLEGDIAKDEKTLASIDPSMRSYKLIVKSRDARKAELEKADEKRKEIKEKVDKDTEEKVEKKLAEVHKDVLAEAAKEAKMKFEDIGPYSRKLSESPRFRHQYPGLVQAIFSNGTTSAFEADDTTELQEDTINEVTYMAACTKVEPATTSKITRRQWLSRRKGDYQGTFDGKQMQKVLDQSFTMEALKAAFKWVQPKQTDEEDGPRQSGTGDENTKASTPGKGETKTGDPKKAGGSGEGKK